MISQVLAQTSLPLKAMVCAANMFNDSYHQGVFLYRVTPLLHHELPFWTIYNQRQLRTGSRPCTKACASTVDGSGSLNPSLHASNGLYSIRGTSLPSSRMKEGMNTKGRNRIMKFPRIVETREGHRLVALARSVACSPSRGLRTPHKLDFGTEHQWEKLAFTGNPNAPAYQILIVGPESCHCGIARSTVSGVLWAIFLLPQTKLNVHRCPLVHARTAAEIRRFTD